MPYLHAHAQASWMLFDRLLAAGNFTHFVPFCVITRHKSAQSDANIGFISEIKQQNTSPEFCSKPIIN